MAEPLGRGKRQRPTSPEVALLPAQASMEVQISDTVGHTQQEARFDPGLSFKAIVARSNASSPPPVCHNASFISISESDFEVGKEAQGPTIRFSKALKDKLILPWKNALIVKLLGVKHTFKYFELKLRKKWALLKSHWSVMDIADDYYIVRFDSEEDRNYVLTEGPWIITGRYLVIQKWEPSFSPSVHCIRKLTVWLCISALHVEWFDINVLTTIGNLLGNLHRVDMRSVTFSRGQYARLCVEIDITKPLERSIKVDDIWYLIQYEALHMVCFNCGIFGHDTDKCPTKNRMDNVAPFISTPATNDENAGVGHSADNVPSLNSEVALHFSAKNLVQPSGGRGNATTPIQPSSGQVVNRTDASQWQQVPTRRSRRQPQPQAPPPPPQNASGSRFQVLSEEERQDDTAAHSFHAKFNPNSCSQPFVSTRNSPLGSGQGRVNATTKQSAAAKNPRAAKGKAVQHPKQSIPSRENAGLPKNVVAPSATSFPIPQVFRSNVATADTSETSPSSKAQPSESAKPMDATITPTPPSTDSGPKIQTNIADFQPGSLRILTNAASTGGSTGFPIPTSFSFNMARELPKAVLDSRPPRPLDPPAGSMPTPQENDS